MMILVSRMIWPTDDGHGHGQQVFFLKRCSKHNELYNIYYIIYKIFYLIYKTS